MHIFTRFLPLFLGLILQTTISLSAPIINQTAGVVDQEIVTAREVQIGTLVNAILEKSTASMKSLELNIGDAKFVEAAATYLIEMAAVHEADSFNIGEPESASIKEVMNQVQKRWAGRNYWKALEVDDAILQKIVSLKLKAKNFIQIKADSMVGIVTDVEAQAYFEKNRLKFGSSSFGSLKENIKGYLAKQQKAERLQVWFEVLRKKYKVRNLMLENVRNVPAENDSKNPSQ